MNKFFIFFVIIIQLFLASCIAEENIVNPTLNKQAFEGFSLENIKDDIRLNGYKYQTRTNNEKTFNHCSEVINYNYADIAPYMQIHFKLLNVSCVAINKYKKATSSTQSFFPDKLTINNYKSFPALSTPFLSNDEYKQRKNKSIEQSYKTLKITAKKNSATLITKEDEIYITILARGDFNNDKIEDLLVSSEWYAKNAHGKHTDLVILSKTGKDKAIKIDWRMNTIK